MSLVNATMDWIKHNIADDIDFVIWTGDSARHDNDDKRPRTRRQVVQQNEMMVEKFVEVFGTKKGHGSSDVFRIPIVPTFGNNDIMPHNILLKGPNEWTMKYLDIWRGMVPEAQRHQFQQGGWFSVEVIPGKLAVISLNTMYFFTSNSGVDGCANKHEPGYEQFEWLRIQLQIMRDRGMSAILIGHVPPARVNSKESWEDTCWQKYALWERQYRDVILASLFGHMNIDHFMLQDFKKIKKGAKKGLMGSKRVKNKKANAVELLEDGEVTVASASDYLLDLRKTWAKLPSPSSKESRQSSAEFDETLDEFEEVEEAEEEEDSMWSRISNFFSKSKKGGKKPKKGKTYLEKIGGEYAERYSVSMVSPSVVPNYFPTLRIFTYNTTGLEDTVSASQSESPRSVSSTDQDREQTPILPSLPPSIDIDIDIDADIPDYDDNDDDDDDTAYLRYINAALKRKRKDKERESLKKKKKYKFKVPAAPSKSAPPGPAYSPQPLTLLSYTQYFANLTQLNNDFVTASPPPPSTLQTANADAPSTIFGLALFSRSPDDDDDDMLSIEPRGWKEGKHHKHQGKKPRPKPHPKPFAYEVEYDTRSDERYGLEDLTVRRWVELAGRLGRKESKSKSSVGTNGEEEEEDDGVEKKGGKKNKKHKKRPKVDKKSPWFTFVRRAFVGSMDPRDIDAVFGGRGEAAAAADGLGEAVDEWDEEDVYDVDVDEEGEEQADGDEVMEL